VIARVRVTVDPPIPHHPTRNGAHLVTQTRRRSRWLRTAVVATAASAIAFGGLVPATAATAAGRDDSASWAGNAANPYGGTDYFVDAGSGSDAASGTSRDQAWQTLDKVSATTFSPGDRILLKGGETWPDQQMWPKGSGTAEKPIVIDAYGDEDGRLPYIATNGQVQSPFLPDGTKNPDTVGLTGAVNLQNQEYVHIANLELSNDDDFAVDITSGSFVRDGVSVSINADKLPEGADTIMAGIRVSNLDVHNIDGPSTWQRIHYAGVNFQVFGSKQWTEYGTGGYHFRDVRIENNTFHNVELHAVQFAFNWFGDAQGRADETGKFHEGWEQLWVRDQDFYSRDVYIGHNYAESIGQGPYQFANTQRLLAEYNEANGWLERYNQVSAGLYLWAGADSVMRFNEIYDGPANQYDATPWDLEFTNFDVLYEYNYSHDNQGGWMSYMGNSSNSIARYNLSVNDNGVIWKNMLSSNYAPTYVANNVFVYDGSKLHSVHDEVLKDTVYFFNNVFYNTSTTPTTWEAKAGGLDLGVFSNNAYYEAGGSPSPSQPEDAGAVTADPQFVGDVADYATNAGVENIRESAAPFKLAATSPLIDQGRYNERIGTEDFFGAPNYRGAAPDIGIHEYPAGEVVTAPVDTDPIEDENEEQRDNLALYRPVVASSTHPHNNFTFSAAKLVDGDKSTRWAAADDATYPLTIDIDFGEPTRFDEVNLDEFTDSGTAERVAGFELQSWDDGAGAWTTFATGEGIGKNEVVTFDAVTSSKLRLSVEGIRAGEQYAPTMTEIAVYDNTPVVTDPAISPTRVMFDRSADRADDASNAATFEVDLGGDTVRSMNYVTPSGAVVGSLDASDYERTVSDEGREAYRLTPAFFADKELGTSAIDVDFDSDRKIRVTVEIYDSTPLVAALAQARSITPQDSPEYAALESAIVRAAAVLDEALLGGAGTSGVTEQQMQAEAAALRAATLAVGAAPGADPGATPGTEPGAQPGDGPSSGAGAGDGDVPGTGTGSLATTGGQLGWGLGLAGFLVIGVGAAAIIAGRSRRATEEQGARV